MHSLFDVCAHHYVWTAATGVACALTALFSTLMWAMRTLTSPRRSAVSVLAAGVVVGSVTTVRHTVAVRQDIVRSALVHKYGSSIEKFGQIPDDWPSRSIWVIAGQRRSCQLAVSQVEDPVLTCRPSLPRPPLTAPDWATSTPDTGTAGRTTPAR